MLIRIAEEEGLLGPHLRLFEAVGRVHPELLGRTLPLNGAGVCGAALCDLGFPVDILRGFALLARAAGLVGHIAEEMRRPVGPAIYDEVDRTTTYDPPQTAAEAGWSAQIRKNDVQEALRPGPCRRARCRRCMRPNVVSTKLPASNSMNAGRLSMSPGS